MCRLQEGGEHVELGEQGPLPNSSSTVNEVNSVLVINVYAQSQSFSFHFRKAWKQMSRKQERSEKSLDEHRYIALLKVLAET